MTRRRRRIYAISAGMISLGLATVLALSAFSDSLVFFYSPSDLQTKAVSPDQALRLGGLVEMDSVQQQPDGVSIAFKVTDGAHAVPVTYRGIIPDLFREGQGVVAEGKLAADGTFVASQILAKHDENYMPPEVADALKRSGHWMADGSGPAPGGASAATAGAAAGSASGSTTTLTQ
ncbi:cytochrome c maturation protein CcmE [Zavarzinia sp. CC-PAN008]|uniref:cytochrome c maturation protein CcmE n=1 Tax=Zavarzinia sp. CC-PAN008 TaxID=3243332 RepID=UPI003F745D2A